MWEVFHSSRGSWGIEDIGRKGRTEMVRGAALPSLTYLISALWVASRDSEAKSVAHDGDVFGVLYRQKIPESYRGSMTRPAHSLSAVRGMGCPTTTRDSFPTAGPLCRVGLPAPRVLPKGFYPS
jgi:hypothetical protein